MQIKPTKAQLDGYLQHHACEIVQKMNKWKSFADMLNQLTDEELTAIGYDEPAIAYVRSFQAALTNIELKYRNQAPANSDDPSYFVAQFLPMLVFG